MSDTFNLGFFTNTNDKINALELRGVKIIIENDLLVISSYGMSGYQEGGEVYNYLNSHFGDEKRGVFEIPLKSVKNVAINKVGLRSLTCIEFGGHGIIILGLKSKTVDFTRKLTTQIEKNGYNFGLNEQNMPELKIIDGVSDEYSPWMKYLICGLVIFACILFVLDRLNINLPTINKSEKIVELTENSKKEPIFFDEEAQTEYCSKKWTRIGKLDVGMFNYCLNMSKTAYKEYLYIYKKYTTEIPIEGFEEMLKYDTKDWLKKKNYNFWQYVFTIKRHIESYLNTEYELKQGTYSKSQYKECKRKWFPSFNMIDSCLENPL